MRLCRYDGEFVKDDYFERNYKEAKKAGLQVGAYFYTTDNEEEKLRSHMKWIKEQLDGRELDFPLVFDWESWNRVQRYHLSIEGLNHLMDVFAEEAESFGYDAMLYGSKYYLDIIWGRRNDYPVWVAQYKSYTDYEGDYEIWQSTNIGRINGIAGDVDFDVWYLDAAETDGAENVNSENENAVKDNAENGNESISTNVVVNGVFKITLNNQSATTGGTGEIYELYNDGWYDSVNVTNKITSITKPTRTGYTFGGYYTGTNGSGTQYVNSSGAFVNNRYQVAANVTLYAYWIPNIYNVTLDHQDGINATYSA
jgi:uncharacterized repeat protein (TIGR02543 family)